jgi:2-keto-3-deoxy-6-phosphogluconate aldolase
MALKAAFIFLAPDVNPAVHRAQVITPAVELTVVAAHNYAQAEQVARTLVDEGIVAIELCGGFGNEGTARMVKAVQGKAAVGAVRFDCHPGLGGKSGDALFG